MLESFTAAALRTLGRAESRARGRGAEAIEVVDLIAGMVDEPESRAAALLDEYGPGPDRLLEAIGAAPGPIEDDDDGSSGSAPLPRSAAVRMVLRAGLNRAKAHDRSEPVGTEHVLAGLLPEPGGPSTTVGADLLVAAGVDVGAIRDRLAAEAGPTGDIPVPADLPTPELADPGEAVELARILDASANRAREGLRVVEDYARFVLDDPGLTRRLKDVRHRLAETIRGFDPDLLIGARDTPGDVGTGIMTAAESTRESPRAVLAANFKRTAEALRTLEEYAKLFDTWIAGRFEVLRYDVYTLEKLTLAAATSRKALGEARLMVLVGGLATLGDLTWIVSEALEGGADVIQLREKGVDDREWLRRARDVRILTARAGARFVVNDRPDLARLAGADGVHLGQDDISVRDARRIVGPNALIGVSTHDATQLDRAVLDAASYLGVGPVFAGPTKTFETYAGLAHVRRAAETTTLPWFAIGGIDETTIGEVIEAGARRVAVSGAVVRAEFPRKAAASLRTSLDAAWS